MISVQLSDAFDFVLCLLHNGIIILGTKRTNAFSIDNIITSIHSPSIDLDVLQTGFSDHLAIKMYWNLNLNLNKKIASAISLERAVT